MTRVAKSNPGRFFEDFELGQTLVHALPRTLTDGDRALYTSLYPSQFPLFSADPVAVSLGYDRAPLDDLIVFHTVFGKSVPDLSLNAVANLGYAEGRFLRPVYAGDTLQATSEVIGLKETSSGKTGIVWVRTTGSNQDGAPVLTFCRWVMVRKRNPSSPSPSPHVPELAERVEPEAFALDRIPTRSNHSQDGYHWEDYAPGEHIDHVDAVTLTDPEHMMATRLWQNTARVHFDVTARPDGQRLIYGGHILSIARALSGNGMANAQVILGINGGAHANPAVAGDTVYAGSTILDAVPTAREDFGALRVRLIAAKSPVKSAEVRDADGKYKSDILLDMDIWLAIPRAG